MSLYIQINDPDEMQVTLRISGGYSPDVVDDLKRRLIDTYREAWDERLRYPDLTPTQDEPSSE